MVRKNRIFRQLDFDDSGFKISNTSEMRIVGCMISDQKRDGGYICTISDRSEMDVAVV